MIRRFFIYFSLIFAFMATTLAVLFSLGFSLVAVPVSVSEPAPRGVVLLVPLDSRPPCTDYVASLARMAGFQILQVNSHNRAVPRIRYRYLKRAELSGQPWVLQAALLSVLLQGAPKELYIPRPE